ncbi:Hypothetical_protein [Hexamita inflata]|uniref:Hypothetical_protein n=1 Tax=Hexamita inflata TaxID=28002 RepID=A0AA86P3A5_9EUKA|nr:Hypothetical protein HINF_LOCUS7315 [Hexamita inflata]CAI9919674.1 Hypothetical protein HINF_LOCUS7319 [Hexamita inflata]CAI9929871.1 Hypothetical protein HINF_LOCUS17516 [Hexamita inflata]
MTKRSILPKAWQTEVDDRILELISQCVKFKGYDNTLTKKQELAIYFALHRAEISKQKLIKWYQIDQALEIKRYSTKSYAYKRFVDVILPKLLPPYPKQIQADIKNFIDQRLQLETNLNNKTNLELQIYRKELEKEVKTRFKLKGTDPYQFKKQVDKNRYYIQMLIVQKSTVVLEYF